MSATATEQLSSLVTELPHVAAPLLPFITLGPNLDYSASQGAPHPSPEGTPGTLSGSHTDRQILPTQQAQLDDESAAALALPPVLMPRHRTYQLTEKGILEMTGVSLVGMLTQLNLHGSALKRIEVSHSAAETDKYCA